ncbi:MAG: hypothetical protein LAT50_01235 [Ectothiorhodospiraceae bacterium]|nr:hypothetical protein [Ectothiorhodospiraceae bacterium]
MNQVHLPNSTTFPYPQPGGGQTILVALAGAPGAIRTPEQQAADTEKGWQWWDRAILAGPQRQLHGQPLGQRSWIYEGADGRRWLARLSDPGNGNINFSTRTSVDVEFTEFGAFIAREPEVYVRTATVSDWEQSTPPVLVGSTVNTGVADLEDATPTGDETVWRIRQSVNRSSYPGGVMLTALGYFTLSVTGSGETLAVTLDVVRSREQTLGVWSLTGSDPELHSIYWTDEESSGWLGPEDPLPPWSGIAARANASIGTGTRLIQMGNKIIGMKYMSGILVDVVYSLELESEFDFPVPDTTIDDNDVDISQSTEVFTEATATITFGLQSVSLTSATEYTANSVLAGEDGDYSNDRTMVWETTTNYNYVSSGMEVDTDIPPTSSGYNLALYVTPDSVNQPSAQQRDQEGPHAHLSDIISNTSPASFQNAGYQWYRHSNNVFGFAGQYQGNNDSHALMTLYGSVYPTGSDDQELLSRSTETELNVQHHASWCPVTEQVAYGWEESAFADEFVCWV